MLLDGTQHRVQVKVEARTTNVTKDQHLGVLKNAQVHPGDLLARGTLGEVLVVDARNHVVALRECHLLEAVRLAIRTAIDSLVEEDVVAKDVAVEVDDVRLAAAEQAHPVPPAWPGPQVEKVLPVLDGLLRKQHA